MTNALKTARTSESKSGIGRRPVDSMRGAASSTAWMGAQCSAHLAVGVRLHPDDYYPFGPDRGGVE